MNRPDRRILRDVILNAWRQQADLVAGRARLIASFHHGRNHTRESRRCGDFFHSLDALGLGADIVFQSATKYLGGHSDLTAGALVTAAADSRWQEITLARKLMGGILPAFEAWLLIRGMRTLFVRFERASANAMAIARHFENHPKIERVLYPGLKSHPGHMLASRQMTNGFSGMLSLLIKGDGAAARQVANDTEVFMPATSLGGVESLIEHRKTVEGPHSRVPENLLRLSVGIEARDDLIGDLEQALVSV
ncbi:MAG: PLP-dependent transferase [Pseudomonadota bacterium]